MGWIANRPNVPAGQQHAPRLRSQSRLPAQNTPNRSEVSGSFLPSPDTPDSFMSDSQMLTSTLSPLLQTPLVVNSSSRVVPSPRTGMSFEWTVPNDPHSSSYIRDTQGNTLYSTKSPRTGKTVIADDYGDVVGRIKFLTYSKPTVRLNRDANMRIKDWIRFSRELKCRYVLLRGDQYFLFDAGDRFSIFKNRTDDCVGSITIDKQSIKLDLASPVLVLLEEFVIIATILLVSRRKGKGIWGSKLTERWTSQVQ